MAQVRTSIMSVATQGSQLSHRLVLTCLMVLSILVAGFISNSAAHAAFDGGKPVAEQTVEAKATVVAHADHKAPHGKSFGSASCTGHCASHVMTLAAPASLVLAFLPPTTAWPAWTATVAVTAAASRLDRPPRA